MKVKLLVLVTGVALTLAVTGCRSAEETSRVSVDLAPITHLAGSANQDAETMEQHAAAMTTAAGNRPELAQWRAEADTIRANAKSLRLLAAWAAAIHHDPGARSGESAELGRILGDGKNLEQLGETLIAHAGAMQAHLSVMRQQAASDATLTAAVTQLSTDSEGMKGNGQAAIDRAKELQETARRLAQSMGTKLN